MEKESGVCNVGDNNDCRDNAIFDYFFQHDAKLWTAIPKIGESKLKTSRKTKK